MERNAGESRMMRLQSSFLVMIRRSTFGEDELTLECEAPAPGELTKGRHLYKALEVTTNQHSIISLIKHLLLKHPSQI
jgi:hypothetical protein